MRHFNKSQNASCLASNLKNAKRLADLGRHDITRMYLQIRLGANALLAGWFGHLRHATPVRVTTRPVMPVGAETTPQGTGVLSQRSLECRGGKYWRPSFAFFVR
jgi:hypothetical protein